jgi:MFS family permease
VTVDVDARLPETRRRAGLITLVSAHGVSTLGEAMTIVAVPWFVLQTTGSIAQTGAVVAVAGIAAAVAGFLAGPFVDRIGFKRFAVLGYVISGSAVGAVVLFHAAGILTFPALLLLVLLATGADAPRMVAMSGLVPRLARDAGTPLERANSAFRATSNLSALVGPALGGVAAAYVGAENVLLFDAAACLCAAALVAALIRQPLPAPAPAGPAAAPAKPAAAPAKPAAGPAPAANADRYLSRLREGVRTLRGAPLLRWVTTISTAQNLLDSAMSGVILVSIAHFWFDDAASFGAMVTAIGLGALAGTLGYGAVGHRLPRRPVFIGTGFAIAVPVMVLASAPPFWAVMLAMALFGLVMAPRGPLVVSALQEAVPREIYGRVVGAIRIVAAGAAPIGIGLAALAVATVGVQAAVTVIGACYLAIGLVCWRVRALRHLDTVRGPVKF